IRRLMASGSATDVPPNFMTTLTTGSPGRSGLRGTSPGARRTFDLPDPPGLHDSPGQPDRASSQEPLALHQLAVQDRPPGGAANRVVPERDELVVEHRARAQTADGDRHPAAAVDVERRLRAVRLGQVDDRLLRRRRQAELLRPAAEAVPRADDRLGVRVLL